MTYTQPNNHHTTGLKKMGQYPLRQYLVVTTLAIVFFSYNISLAQAETVTTTKTATTAAAKTTTTPKPSPSASAKPTSESPTTTSKNTESTNSADLTTQNLRERIERIVEEKRDQIKGVLSEISITQRGVIGEVQRVTEESITIRTHKGTEIIPITNTAYTVELVKANKSIKPTEIAVGDWLLALGVIEEDNFQPIRIAITSSSLRPRTRSITIGSIANLEKTELTIESRSATGSVTYTTNKDTKYQDLSGASITAVDIEESMQAIVAGYVIEPSGSSNTTQRVAKLVRVLTTVSEDN